MISITTGNGQKATIAFAIIVITIITNANIRPITIETHKLFKFIRLITYITFKEGTV